MDAKENLKMRQEGELYAKRDIAWKRKQREQQQDDEYLSGPEEMPDPIVEPEICVSGIINNDDLHLKKTINQPPRLKQRKSKLASAPARPLPPPQNPSFASSREEQVHDDYPASVPGAHAISGIGASDSVTPSEEQPSHYGAASTAGTAATDPTTLFATEAIVAHAELVVVDGEKPSPEVNSLKKDVNELRQQNRNIRIVLIIAILLAVIGTVLGLVFGLRRPGNNSSESNLGINFTPSPTVPATPFPTSNFANTIILLVQSELPELDFTDSNSPQSRAVQWMSQEDILYSSALPRTRLLQRFALVTLAYSTGGAKEAWLERPARHECEFDEVGDQDGRPDVTCNGDEVVRRLLMCCDNIMGTLPGQVLGLLTALSRLDLHSNQVSGTIPTEFGILTDLDWLDLFDNQFQGTVPTEIGALTNLGWWSIADNQLFGSLPTEIGELTKLTLLFIQGNELLSGSIPTHLCPNFERADVECDRIDCECCQDHSGTACPGNTFGTLAGTSGFDTRLRSLIESDLETISFADPNSPQSRALEWMTTRDAIYSSTLTEDRLRQRFAVTSIAFGAGGEKDPWLIAGVGNHECTFNDFDDHDSRPDVKCNGNSVVTKLLLCCDNLVGELPGEEITYFQALRILDFHKNKMFGTIPTFFGKLRRLEHLDLATNEFVGTVPSELGALRRLVWLSVAQNANVSGPVPIELGQTTKLRTLFLYGTELTGSVPASICRHENFNRIDIDCGEIQCECCQDSNQTAC